MPAVKRWIAYGAAVKGSIHVNEGAKAAILEGSSLLPVGVTKVVGIFDVGDVVSLEDEKNIEFARGNPNYNSSELNLIKGLQISEVEKKLGAKPREVIEHRNIHLMEEEK
jgi:glutamate 5-kinase